MVAYICPFTVLVLVYRRKLFYANRCIFSNFRNEILAFETQYNKEWLSVITRQPLVCTVFNKLRYMIFPIEREKCERWNLSFE